MGAEALTEGAGAEVVGTDAELGEEVGTEAELGGDVGATGADEGATGAADGALDGFVATRHLQGPNESLIREHKPGLICPFWSSSYKDKQVMGVKPSTLTIAPGTSTV